MVSAIKYCHARSPPIAHRGLNPANVLLTGSSDFAGVKTQITDFALPKHMSCPSSLTTFCKTELFIAPEVRRQLDDEGADPYTPAVDVCSLGVVLHYMLFGRQPACARANHTGLSTSTELSGSSNAHGKTVSEPARYLIDGMLTSDVGQRHSVEEITGCQWLCDEVTLAQLRKTIFKDIPIF
ncbi:ovarian-specific serine/threonine-protein kinase Lok-like [Daphnia pulex]|uniref:ovarian-specific serine/threonine-protein kinase Lok-like n=1 Tax=Daphnia pulex TaxID=6669 RepID=UPI001EE066AD|nr:ovarian-specific serine/threonine-protein kinase Lok-like [Daphnia pulex]